MDRVSEDGFLQNPPVPSTTAARRGLLAGGLGLVFRRPGTLWWVYGFNVLLACLFSLRFGAQAGDVMNHSLHSQRLANAFDLGVVADTFSRIGRDAPDTGSSGNIGPLLYLLLYFLLVPGILLCFQTLAASKLSTMLGQGLLHFWRFGRITLLAAIVSGLILGPLVAAQTAWAKHVDERVTGYAAIAHVAPLWLLIFLVAALLRLYFDLVEAYTVQLGQRIRDNGKPDRRVRRTLLPAFQTLFRRGNFWRTYGVFLLLTVFGLAGWLLTWRVAIHTLAQPRVWPLILLGQLGILLLLLSRVWQRGVETILSLDFPIPLDHSQSPPFVPVTPYTAPAPSVLDPDPLPPTEPVSPSLDRPDPAVFRAERRDLWAKFTEL